LWIKNVQQKEKLLSKFIKGALGEEKESLVSLPGNIKQIFYSMKNKTNADSGKKLSCKIKISVALGRHLQMKVLTSLLHPQRLVKN